MKQARGGLLKLLRRGDRMKLLPKQLKQNQEALSKYRFSLVCDDEGKAGMDQGYCEITGLWTNTRVTIAAVDFGELLVDRSIAFAIEDGESLDQAIDAVRGA